MASAFTEHPHFWANARQRFVRKNGNNYLKIESTVEYYEGSVITWRTPENSIIVAAGVEPWSKYEEGGEFEVLASNEEFTAIKMVTTGFIELYVIPKFKYITDVITPVDYHAHVATQVALYNWLACARDFIKNDYVDNVTAKVGSTGYPLAAWDDNEKTDFIRMYSLLHDDAANRVGALNGGTWQNSIIYQGVGINPSPAFWANDWIDYVSGGLVLTPGGADADIGYNASQSPFFYRKIFKSTDLSEPILISDGNARWFDLSQTTFGAYFNNLETISDENRKLLVRGWMRTPQGALVEGMYAYECYLRNVAYAPLGWGTDVNSVFYKIFNGCINEPITGQYKYADHDFTIRTAIDECYEAATTAKAKTMYVRIKQAYFGAVTSDPHFGTLAGCIAGGYGIPIPPIVILPYIVVTLCSDVMPLRLFGHILPTTLTSRILKNIETIRKAYIDEHAGAYTNPATFTEAIKNSCNAVISAEMEGIMLHMLYGVNFEGNTNPKRVLYCKGIGTETRTLAATVATADNPAASAMTAKVTYDGMAYFDDATVIINNQGTAPVPNAPDHGITNKQLPLGIKRPARDITTPGDAVDLYKFNNGFRVRTVDLYTPGDIYPYWSNLYVEGYDAHMSGQFGLIASKDRRIMFAANMPEATNATEPHFPWYTCEMYDEGVLDTRDIRAKKWWEVNEN